MAIKHMGKFTAIGMRTPAKDLNPNSIVINTCSKNDTAEKGDFNAWAWANPTNRAITHFYQDISAVPLSAYGKAQKF